MDANRRKAEIAAFKERKTAAGIYVIRCTASGEHWVGRAPDIDTVWRRLNFDLGLGGGRLPSLQAAWRMHGAATFTFEVLERIEEEIDYLRDRKLAARLAYWREASGLRSNDEAMPR